MEKIGVFDKISKVSIYLLVFLIPIFFLPFTQNVLDYQKQTLLVALVSISLISQIIKFLIEGKISYNSHPIHLLILLALLIFGLSTIFSISKAESFFGFPLSISQSFLTLLFLAILYFLINSIFEKREIFYLLLFFSISAFLATLFSTFQLFGKFTFPFDFSKQVSFNTVGSQSSLAIFGACLLPLFLILLSISKRIIKIFFLLAILLSLFFLLLLNFKIPLLILLISSTIFLGFLTTKREIFSPGPLIFSLFFLAISISFLLFNLRIFPVPIPFEVSLGQKLGFEIGLKSFKESPIFGSGPSTFLYQFLKHKGTSLNDTAFWNFRFLSSASKFLDVLSTTGILGTISFLLLILVPIGLGLFKILKGKMEKLDLLLYLAIFVSFLNFSISSFLFPSNLTLEFSFFFLLSCFVNTLAEKRREFLIRRESILSFVFSFVLIFIFVLDFIILILTSQRYVGEVYYWRGILAWQRGDVDGTILNLQKALNFSRIDLYFRDLSQAYLAKLNEKIQKGNQDIQMEAAQAIVNSKNATDLNPISVANWSVRGFTYQSLVGMAQGAEDWAIKSYEEALKLEPANPFFLTQKGMMLLRKGILSQDEKEKGEFFGRAEESFKKAIELKTDYAPAHFQLAMVYYNRGNLDDAIAKLEETKNLVPLDVGLAFQLGVAYYQKGNYQKAKDELERAISITPDYANALYFLGLTYDQLGEKGKAIEKFKRVSELNPDNEEVKKIISNLEAGKKALEGILPTVPPKTPIEEKPPEIKR
jgi:tetratricopeptide (TPR) repeat protein